LLSLAPNVAAQSFTVGFDNVSAPGPFAFITPGFDNGPHLEYQHLVMDGGVILWDVLFGNGSTSPSNICATCDTCMLGDGSGLPGDIRGVFDVDMGRVEIDVLNGSSAGPGNFTLTVFDSAGIAIGSDTVLCNTMGSSGFVKHLAVQASGIRSFAVTTALSTGYTFATDTLVYEIEELGSNYCVATPNSTGQAAHLRATGSTSVGLNDAWLICENVPANLAGIIFYGAGQTQTPLGNGTLCVAPGGVGLFRLPVAFSDANQRLLADLDITVPPLLAGQITAGSTWHFQCWFRDPAAGGSFYDLSEGLSLTFQP
jgi:hypothetical protein